MTDYTPTLYHQGYTDGYKEATEYYWHDLTADPEDIPERGRAIEVVVKIPSGFDQFRWRGEKLPQHAIYWMYVPQWTPGKNDLIGPLTVDS